ncbi:MAG: hypothetical protein ACYDAR_13630 [Thermomicrobiales bacterium]
MIDLSTASRDALIRLVVAQHETIQQQGRIIGDLHAEVGRLTAQVTALTARAVVAHSLAGVSSDGGR